MKQPFGVAVLEAVLRADRGNRKYKFQWIVEDTPGMNVDKYHVGVKSFKVRRDVSRQGMSRWQPERWVEDVAKHVQRLVQAQPLLISNLEE
jgi:hypothetical protein